MVTSTISSHNRNSTVTFPVLVELRTRLRHHYKPDAIFYTWMLSPESVECTAPGCESRNTGRAVPAFILPSRASSAVAGFDRAALRELEKKFGRIPKSGIAQIVAVSKLIDAVRLRDPEKLKQHLAFVRAGAGSEFEAVLREHFDARGWPGLLGWALPHLNALCHLGRLCVWMSNRGGKPMATRGEALRLGVHAADFTSALLLQLMLQMEESASVAYCERCGQVYFRTKQDQRFCGFRCASRERQARYRKAKGRSRESKIMLPRVQRSNNLK